MQNIHTKVNCIVKSTYEHAWSQLWRKAYETEDFVQGLEQVKIIQKTDDYVIRQMKLNGKVVKQRITKDQQNGTVKFHNLPGSDIEGNVFNHILQGQQGQIQLIFYSNAQTKNGDKFPPKEAFQKAMLKTKNVIQSKI